MLPSATLGTKNDPACLKQFYTNLTPHLQRDCALSAKKAGGIF